jgi:hypothetical protein
MVDARERGSDEAEPTEKSNRVKYAKASSLRTQQATARFGKSARHPICQAALALWHLLETIHEYAKEAVSLGELLVSEKGQKEETRALYEQAYKEGKQKETIEAAALLRKIDSLFKKINSAFEASVNLFEIFSEVLLPVALAQFERECDAAARAGDIKSLRALQTVKKRWRANPSGKGARLRDGDLRALGLLQMHRDKVIKAAWATAEARAGYLEAARGGNRPLSDEVWSGRFTVKEMYSHLLATYGPRVAGDKYGKEIRRTLKRLGIRPAEDKRGRKWKPLYPAKQREIVKRICRECGKRELEPKKRLCRCCAIRAKVIGAGHFKQPIDIIAVINSIQASSGKTPRRVPA